MESIITPDPLTNQYWHLRMFLLIYSFSIFSVLPLLMSHLPERAQSLFSFLFKHSKEAEEKTGKHSIH